MKRFKTRGFSIIDLLVSMSIVTLIMSVVLFSYRTFGNKLAVKAASQEIAVAVRQAQVYGTSVKEVSKGIGDFNIGYGVSFDTTVPGQYYIFADKNNNGLYDGDSTCTPGGECVEKNLIRNSAGVTGLCGIDTSRIQTCPPTNATRLSIVFPPSQFQASNADASIIFSNSGGALSGSYTSAVIVTTLGDALTQTTVQSAVTVYQTGQTYVQDLPSVPTTNHPPVITLTGLNPMSVTSGSTFTDPGATASDIEDGNISSQIVMTGTVNTLITGTYTLTYNVTDSGGLPAATVTRTVVVNPASCDPTLAGSASTSDWPNSVSSQGGYVYTVSNGAMYSRSPLEVFDVSNPGLPTKVATTSTGYGPLDVFSQGNYAYVVINGEDKFQVFNISNPLSPTLVGSVNTGSHTYGISIGDPGYNWDHPYSVFVQGNYAYVINNSSNTLQIFDISNPTNPTSVALVSTGNTPVYLYVAGNYAYVVNVNSNTLQVFNVSNPANPISVASVSTGIRPHDISIQNNYAYIVNFSSNTLQVFDISNPASPVVVASVGTNGYPYSISIQGTYAYVTNMTTYTLQVFNISNPLNPVSVGLVSTGIAPVGVSLQTNYAYVVNNNSNTLQVFNLTCF